MSAVCNPFPAIPITAPHCGHAVNTLTPYLPYIEIPFYTRFIVDSIRMLKTPGSPVVYRIGALLELVVLLLPFLPFLPVLLLFGLGYLVYRSWNRNPAA